MKTPKGPKSILVVALFIMPPVGAGATEPAQFASEFFTTNGGFCLDGVFGLTRWPEGERPEGLTAWGSFCPGDFSVGRIESADFLAPSALTMYLAGYPGLPGRRLSLVNAASAQEIELQPKSVPAEMWTLATFPLPAAWVGQRVHLVADDEATGAGGWLGFTEPLLPYSSVSMGQLNTDRPQSGFCRDGVFPATKWPAEGRPLGVASWGSYCKSGNADVGWMASQPVIAGAYISLYVAGYPGTRDVALVVENLQNRRQLFLHLAEAPRELWHRYFFRLPSDWNGQKIRVIAEDRAVGPFGWLAFTEPLPGGEDSKALGIIGHILLFLVIFLLLILGCCAFAVSCGLQDTVDLIAISLACSGVIAYAAFWIYLYSRAAGLTYSYVTFVVSCAMSIYVFGFRRNEHRLLILKRFGEPWLLVALAGVFILTLGFIHNTDERPLIVAAARFGPPTFSSDNSLPKVLGDDVYNRHIPKPMIGDWLSSDRPPLQAGFYLWNRGWAGDSELSYQVISTMFHCSFLAGLWAFLIASNSNRKAAALALAMALFYGYTIHNLFYVAPKVLPTAYLLVLAAYLLTGAYQRGRSRWYVGGIVGASAALAMLGHGGSAFALVGIGATMVLLHRIPGRRFVLTAVCAGVTLYIPWTMYQKYYDPPGDRLLKWQLAGVVAPHPEIKFGDLVFQSYGDLKVRELLYNKTSNFTLLWWSAGAFWEDFRALIRHAFDGRPISRGTAAASLRSAMAYRWAPCAGLALLGPPALLFCLLLRRKSPEFPPASNLWLSNTFALMAWCLLLFGPSSTYVHQSASYTELIPVAACPLALWGLSRILAICVAACHILFHTFVYGWISIPPPVGLGTVLGPVRPLLAATCALAALSIMVLLWRFANSEPVANVGDATLAKANSGLSTR
jgi:hypothetical protein